MTYFLFTCPVLPKCQYLMKYRTEFSHVQSEWSANGVVPNLSFFSQIDHPKWLPLPLLKIVKNIKRTVSHELPNGFCQNMRRTDAFIEF